MDLLDRAVSAIRRLPPARQDDAAQLLLHYVELDAAYVLSDAEIAALEQSEAAAACGEFATDQEIEAIWARHGL